MPRNLRLPARDTKDAAEPTVLALLNPTPTRPASVSPPAPAALSAFLDACCPLVSAKGCQALPRKPTRPRGTRPGIHLHRGMWTCNGSSVQVGSQWEARSPAALTRTEGVYIQFISFKGSTAQEKKKKKKETKKKERSPRATPPLNPRLQRPRSAPWGGWKRALCTTGRRGRQWGQSL